MDPFQRLVEFILLLPTWQIWTIMVLMVPLSRPMKKTLQNSNFNKDPSYQGLYIGRPNGVRVDVLSTNKDDIKQGRERMADQVIEPSIQKSPGFTKHRKNVRDRLRKRNENRPIKQQFDDHKTNFPTSNRFLKS